MKLFQRVKVPYGRGARFEPLVGRKLVWSDQCPVPETAITLLTEGYKHCLVCSNDMRKYKNLQYVKEQLAVYFQ
jgi:hypothetical protein